MRLLNPGLGELVDRLTILGLKIIHGREIEKDVSHWEAEQVAIADRLLIHLPRSTGEAIAVAADLAAVNAALWQAEDALRAYRRASAASADWEDIAGCAFRIQRLNDMRASLIRDLSDGPAEKLHDA
ncbi:MAG TPA: hypothetical protein VIM84_14180 [Gemmatimonadales bacterium]